MTKVAYDNPSIGCYVDESCGSADDCNRQTIDFAQNYGFEFDESELPSLDEESAEGREGEYSQALSEYADKAIDYLNDCEQRPFLYWSFDDNSLFLSPGFEEAKEDCEFVSSKGEDYPPNDFKGEWLHISDHGSCTLYNRNSEGKDVEIWACV